MMKLKHSVKSIFMLTVMLSFSLGGAAQWIKIDSLGGSPDASAALEVSDTSRGFLPPRLTTAQANNIPSPANGLLVFNTDSACYCYYDGTAWRTLVSDHGSVALLQDADKDTYIIVDSAGLDPDYINVFQAGVNTHRFIDGRIELLSRSGMVAIGLDAGMSDGNTGANTYVGTNAGESNVSGISVTAVGYDALTNSTADYNSAFGFYSLRANTNGVDNAAFGDFTLTSATASGNSAFGSGALNGTTTGSDNTSVGRLSLFKNTTGFQNTAVGARALENSSTGINNVAIGFSAMDSIITGSANVAVGVNALGESSNGAGNVAVGEGSMEFAKGAFSTVAIGTNTLRNHTGSYESVAIGYRASGSQTSGTGNVVVGFGAGENSNGSNNVFLGYKAGRDEAGSNKLYINNDTSATPLLYGDFATDILTVNGKLGVGTTNPQGQIHVLADAISSGTIISESTIGESRIKLKNNQDEFWMYVDDSSRTELPNGGVGFYDAERNKTRMAIDSSGKVGIGTTSPSGKLEIKSDGSKNELFMKSLTNASANTFYMDRANAAEAAMTSGNTFGIIKGRGFDGTNYIEGARINFTGDGTLGTNDMPGRIEFLTTADGASVGTERMRITSAGNVGIGLTNPGFKLAIVAPTPADANGAHIQLVEGTGLSSMHIGRASTYGFVQTQNAHPLVLNPIANNVGIGTTAPVTKLHVEGTADASLTNDGIAVFGTKTGANMVLDANEIMSRNNGSAATFYLQNDGGDFVVGGNNLFVSAGGTVGIGSTSPTNQLQIVGSNTAVDGRFGTFIDIQNAAYANGSSNAVTTGIRFKNVSGNFENAYTHAGIMFQTTLAGGYGNLVLANKNSGTGTPVKTSDADLVITPAGNVGIGSASPSEKLDVEGSIQIDGDYKYEVAKTSYYSISHAAFDIAATNNNVYVNRTLATTRAYLVSTRGGTATNKAYLVAPVNLPNGAVVTSVLVRVFDNNGTYNMTARLIRQLIISSTSTDMTSVSSTGSAGAQSLSDNTIVNATINNNTYSYFLQIDTQENSSVLGVYGAKITYTTTKAQ